MNRHKQREQAMFCLYQHLLLNKDINIILEEMIENEEIRDGYFMQSLTVNAVKNKVFIIEEIQKRLTDWEFDRLGYIEQSILLLAGCELYSENDEKAVVIDEAIKLAKFYCDDDTYKLINGVLDRL